MTFNMIPDGKSKAMSTVSHAVDAKFLQKGQGAENKKSGKQEAPKQVDENGKVNFSKKEAAKAAKKEAKQEFKTAAKSGEPMPGKEIPIIPKPNSKNPT